MHRPNRYASIRSAGALVERPYSYLKGWVDMQPKGCII
jgi:hypothetical protein